MSFLTDLILKARSFGQKQPVQNTGYQLHPMSNPNIVSPISDEELTKSWYKSQEYNPAPSPEPTTTPQVTPMPTPMPQSTPNMDAYQPGDSKYMDMEQFRGDYEGNMPNPPKYQADMLWNAFPNEATASATAFLGENLGNPYDPNAVNPYNKNGSVDRGWTHNNSYTFEDLLKRRPGQMAEIGATTPTDAFDPQIAVELAKLVRQDENWNINQGYNVKPWGQWYGWQDNGMDIK